MQVYDKHEQLQRRPSEEGGNQITIFKSNENKGKWKAITNRQPKKKKERG